MTTDPEFMEDEERSIRTGKLSKKSDEKDLINSKRDPKSERTKRIKEYYKAKEEFYEGYKYKKLLDQLMMQNKIIEELERKESLKQPDYMRQEKLITSLTQRVKIGRTQKEQELVAQRLKTMECYNSIFVEPMPKYDHQKDMNWGEIAAIILKAAYKEKKAANNSDMRPE